MGDIAPKERGKTMKHKIPRLTLRAARALAMQELGTCRGLVPAKYTNDQHIQRYEMLLGRYRAMITDDGPYFGITTLTVFGPNGIIQTFFNTGTLCESEVITQIENRLSRYRDFQETIEILSPESCRKLLAEYESGARK